MPDKNGSHKGLEEYLESNRSVGNNKSLSYSKQVVPYKLKWRYNDDRRLHKIPKWVSLKNLACILMKYELWPLGYLSVTEIPISHPTSFQ